MKQYALIIDHESCWGCKTCEVACKQETGASDGIKLISVWEDGPKMIHGKLDVTFRVNVCNHHLLVRTVLDKVCKWFPE